MSVNSEESVNSQQLSVTSEGSPQGQDNEPQGEPDVVETPSHLRGTPPSQGQSSSEPPATSLVSQAP